MTTLAEERVLKPLQPVPEDVNEWPDFALREVKIFYQGKGRYADLLEASPDIPLCVLGELMPLDDEQEHLALVDSPTHTRMKIDNVTNYSFGQDDNGKPVVWAAGKAGWYEIAPSDRYLQHYNDTIEAIDLFYFMVDQYQKLSPKRKRLGFQVDPFLTAYQKHTDFRIDDDDEAMETIHKHHKFLLKQMVEERENIDWSQTHLWKHLVETYTEEIEELKTSLEYYPQKMEASSTEEDIEEQEEDKSPILSVSENGFGLDGATPESRNSAPEFAKSQHESDAEPEPAPAPQSKSESESESESEAEEHHTDWTHYTKSIFDLLNILRKTSTFEMRTCGIDQLATEVAKMPTFPTNHKAALAAIEQCAEPLLRLMNEAKLRKKFNWSTRIIYAELEATLADEIVEDIKTPAAKRGKDRHRMKSVLRPSGATKSTKRRTAQADEEDEEMTDHPPPMASSPIARRQALPKAQRRARSTTADTDASREDSPSRQLNGHFDANALPELPPVPEAQEMIDLVHQEAKRVGRQNQTSHLQAFLGSLDQF